MGDASRSACGSPLRWINGSNRACTSRFKGTVAKLLCANRVTTACTLALSSIHRIRRGAVSGRTQQTHHVAEEAARGAAYQSDAAGIRIPLPGVVAQVAYGTLDVVHHVRVGV